MYQNEVAFKEVALTWTQNDPEGMKLIESLNPDGYTEEHFKSRETLINSTFLV